MTEIVEHSVRLAAPSISTTFDTVVDSLQRACRAVYGDALVSVAVFGSVGRGAPRPDSDIDVLLVVDPLPNGRMARVQGFSAVEANMEPDVTAARVVGVHTRISPVFKTKEECKRGSPLFLDMVEDARLLVDRDGFFAAVLDRLRTRLAELGSRRVWRGSAWYWDLKPDYQAGDVFEL